MPDQEQRPAEVFPPSEFIQEEMVTRGWRVEDLADRAGWKPHLASEVLAGRRITRLVAYGLGQALGTSSELWLNLQQACDKRMGNAQNSQ